MARLGGRLVSSVELHELFASSSSYVDTITVLPDVHLVLPGRQPIGFGNHSCDPALWHADAYTLTARRDIDNGDEVTVDYGTQTAEPDFTMDCRCGSALCRGTVTGDDWRRPELQQRYGDHWVPALQTTQLSRARAACSWNCTASSRSSTCTRSSLAWKPASATSAGVASIGLKP